jgi:hypothetical protein
MKDNCHDNYDAKVGKHLMCPNGLNFFSKKISNATTGYLWAVKF